MNIQSMVESLFAVIPTETIGSPSVISYLETNDFDKKIAYKICDTVLYSIAIIGVVVVVCVIAAYCYRYFARRMELNRKNACLKDEEKKNIIEEVKKECGVQMDYKQIEDLLAKIPNLKIDGHEVDLIFKHGDNSLIVKPRQESKTEKAK